MSETSDPTVTEKAAAKARETVDQAADAASEKMKTEAEAARDLAAEEVEKTANAADAAAAEFDPNSMQAQAIEQVASRIDDLAAQIRNSDIDRMARLIGDAARRNPMMFVAGAALAGFAATRFLKARDPHRRAGADIDPWAASDTGTAIHTGSRAYRDGTPRQPDLASRGAI